MSIVTIFFLFAIVMFCNDKRFYIVQIDQKNSVLFLRLENDQEKLIYMKHMQ